MNQTENFLKTADGCPKKQNFRLISDFSCKVIQPAGRLDTPNSIELENVLKPVLESERFLVLDLSKCNYLSSTGIRILLKSQKMLMSKHGELILCGTRPEVYHVIELVGMHNAFRFEESPQAACLAVKALPEQNTGNIGWTSGNSGFTFIPSGKPAVPALVWSNPTIAGYNELYRSVGVGYPAEPGCNDDNFPGLFVSTGNAAAFVSPLSAGSSDFRISPDPNKAGIMLSTAISFAGEPLGMVKLNEMKSVTLGQFADAALLLKEQLDIAGEELMMLIIKDRDTAISISVVLLENTILSGLIREQSMPGFETVAGKLTGATFILSDWKSRDSVYSFSDLLNENLVIDNITEVRPIDPERVVKQPTAWVYLSKGVRDAGAVRLTIETPEPLHMECWQEFLIRRLYTDCAKVKVEALHGGYSAQTFQVTSYDPEGRKMRPTVLKMAARNLIERESERCKQYALPYIFNNSAIVLGTEYYGQMGALRYNFVGIGGESSKLKWLTHYFHEAEMDLLLSLFDKVFLRILKPWYAQPVYGFIYPFQDHDPTLTFFPHIYHTAGELFSISADERYIQLDELNRKALNPYWYLKYQYPERRQSAVSYYSSICHGDLNMQNILLDENLNVYLIDFSETKPRSVISDFARLEAIFLIDNAPLDDEKDMNDYVQFLVRFYESSSLYESRQIVYDGKHSEKVARHAALAMRMREYALQSVKGNQDPLPYYLALLEWILPVVCYTLPVAQRRLSVIASAILTEKVSECMEIK